MTKIRKYEIQAKMVLLTTKSITAVSVEDAMERAKFLQESDFVKFLGDYISGNMRITGAYEWELYI